MYIIFVFSRGLLSVYFVEDIVLEGFDGRRSKYDLVLL